MRNWMILAVVLMICMGSYSVRADQYKATALYPGNEAVGVGAAAVLQWEAPQLIVNPEYTVYFGTDPNFDSGPVEGMPQIATGYDPFGAADMDVLTEYFWRIDVYDPNVGGTPTTHTGDRWSFNVSLLPGLLALYNYEDDPNDSSGNGNHGNLQGDAVIIEDATRGMVLNLDGSGDYMNLVEPKTAADLGIDGNKPKSMTAWVYTRSFNGGGLFDVGAHSNGQEFSLRTMDTPNLWRIQYFGGSYDIDFNYDSLNKWLHFALIHDGADTIMYVNGILVAKAPRVLNVSGNDAFRVGQYGGSGFDGLIDDFALWNRALSAEEVREMVLVSDFDNNNEVNVADLNTLTGDWLTDNIVPPVLTEPLTLDNIESYSGGVGYPNWFQSYNDDCPDSFITASLITDDPETPEGAQAIRTVFDFPASCGSDNNWLMVGNFFAGPVFVNQYDELRFWVRTHSDNDPGVIWYLHFATEYESPDGLPYLCTQVGPFSSTEEPDAWREVAIDLRKGYNVEWPVFGNIDAVPYIVGVVVTAVSDNATSATQITIDVDDIRLVDTPGCSATPAADVNGDCIVDMADFAILADEWMKTSMGL